MLVTNPTSLHIPVAIAAARRGCHIFVEKPLSHNLDGIQELMDLALHKKLSVLVGYNMRFHPSIRLIKELLEKGAIGKIVCARAQVGQYLPDWHPGEDYKKGYSAQESLGGGVILDLSHELDYVRWFLGEVTEVFSFCSRVSTLEIGTEDTAEILLRFESGTIAEVHMDYVQRSYGRSCQIIGEEGTILWDFNEKRVRLYSASNNRWRSFPEEKGYERNQMYLDEMKHFINCIQGEEKPMVDALEGKRVLEIALAAKESARTGRSISLTSHSKGF
ncbi:MAG: Gfo/Idh/MocA family oxidoreductase [Chloroflexi bacterium]|nr:Gfo/Idh/MocA family oxidoreductase [Chloroflexota bacterium]